MSDRYPFPRDYYKNYLPGTMGFSDIDVRTERNGHILHIEHKGHNQMPKYENTNGGQRTADEAFTRNSWKQVAVVYVPAADERVQQFKYCSLGEWSPWIDGAYFEQFLAHFGEWANRHGKWLWNSNETSTLPQWLGLSGAVPVPGYMLAAAG